MIATAKGALGTAATAPAAMTARTTVETEATAAAAIVATATTTVTSRERWRTMSSPLTSATASARLPHSQGSLKINNLHLGICLSFLNMVLKLFHLL